jgi:hypothetical protein
VSSFPPSFSLVFTYSLSLHLSKCLCFGMGENVCLWEHTDKKVSM